MLLFSCNYSGFAAFFFLLIRWKHHCGFVTVVQRNNTTVSVVFLQSPFGNISFCCVHMTWQNVATPSLSSEPPQVQSMV